jgi:hypothetical protein
LSIDLINRSWEQTNNTNGPEHQTPDEVVALASNEQVCQAQKEGVDYKETKQYYTVFEVLFFNSMEVKGR